MPRFSIVIPTRNRCETLFYTLQTCLNQIFDDYEIIVSDNYSSDKTKDVAESFDSPKIRYFRTEQPLSMSDSWEYAVSRAQGEYIIVVGDDDGILLHALRDLDLIIRDLNVKVVRWNRVYYNWPSILVSQVANQISIPLNWENCFLESTAISRIANYLDDYTKLPMLYNAAVHRDIVDEVRRKAGRVFLSMLPDISSGVAFAYLVKKYPSIGRPMTINAAAGKSNGIATMFIKDSPVVKEFNTLNAQSQFDLHAFVPDIVTISTGLADAYLKVNEKLFHRDQIRVIDRKLLIMNCLNEIRWVHADEQSREKALQAIRKSISGDRKLLHWFERYIVDGITLASSPAELGIQKGIVDGMMYLDGSDFSANNVLDIVMLYEKITGHSRNPYKPGSFSRSELKHVKNHLARKYRKWVNQIKKLLLTKNITLDRY